MSRKTTIYLALFYIVMSCSKDSEELIISETPEQTVYEDQASEIIQAEISEESLDVYDWVAQMQLPNGLMESSEDTDFVSLYDNALSAITFMAYGDLAKVRKIFDYFNSRIETELEYGTGGFYQFRDRNGDNRRTRWLGDNAWLLIALNNYKTITADSKYDVLREKLEHWIRSQQDIDGGLWGGYRENGTQFHKITEGNLIAFHAVEGYDDFHRGILEFLASQRWNRNDGLIVAWPDNSQYYYALDVFPLAYLIFKDIPTATLYRANRFFTHKVATLSSAEVGGYCFDEDRDVIWLEGTAQMGLAFYKAGVYRQQSRLLETLEKMVGTDENNIKPQGLPYVSNPGSSYGAEPLWDHADKKAALSSSCWYLFNKMGYNPFELGQAKQIPESDKFW